MKNMKNLLKILIITLDMRVGANDKIQLIIACRFFSFRARRTP
jgi:hypothetical protein